MKCVAIRRALNGIKNKPVIPREGEMKSTSTLISICRQIHTQKLRHGTRGIKHDVRKEKGKTQNCQ